MSHLAVTSTVDAEPASSSGSLASEARALDARLARKIAAVCKMLKPFQSLDYDPHSGTISIITELLVPVDEAAQIADVLANRAPEEKIAVRRFADSYKVLLTKKIKV